MTVMSGFTLFAAISSGVAVATLVFVVAPPPPSLYSRLRPYLRPNAADLSERARGTSVGRVFGPMVSQMADSLGRWIERSGSEVTLIRLRQAGWYQGSAEEEMIHAFRIAQLKSVMTGGTVAVGLALIVGMPIPALVALGILGLVVGATRQQGRLGKAIDERRELMRIEIYTVNQLLAMRVRAGGGVVHAVSATVSRGEGAVIDELATAIRLQRSGWRASDSFRRIAEMTPEPFCARTYRLLASAEERGSDLAASLLALSEDVRETRRESIKRTATKRRAAMLVPTIAILAPVLIIFVAAPLPYLITGWQ